MYAKLADNTIIENISASSTPYSIIAIRETYGDAGAVRDNLTVENSTSITIFNDNDEEVAIGSELMLLDDVTLRKSTDGIIVEVKTRDKTDIEKLQDQIIELQDAIIEG